MLNGRSVNVYSYQIPPNATDGITPIDYVLFSISTYSIQAPIQIYNTFSDDFSMIQEKDIDTDIGTGKAIRVNSGDAGFCVGCSIYFIVSTYTQSLYTITALP